MNEPWLVNLVWSLLAGGIGGLVGAIAVALRIGAWRGRMETLLEEHERRIEEIGQRLTRGDEDLAKLSGLRAQMEALASEIRGLRSALTRLVTRDECRARHGGN